MPVMDGSQVFRNVLICLLTTVGTAREQGRYASMQQVDENIILYSIVKKFLSLLDENVRQRVNDGEGKLTDEKKGKEKSTSGGVHLPFKPL